MKKNIEKEVSKKQPNYKKFIEANLRIVNKQLTEVPFILNDIQNSYLENRTNKDIILKARQQGFSSLILAMFFTDFILIDNSHSVVVADKSDNAIGLLNRVKQYLKTYCDKLNINEKDLLHYNSKYQLTNKLNGSTYTIGTAQESNFGRSRTLTNLHLSEAAFYPNLPNLLAGAAQAVVPQGKLILETTANGFNEFKTLWDDSVLKQTAYKPLFFKASSFYDKYTLEERRRELGTLLYQQEYPETPEEAFITSGASYFDKEAMKWYLDNSKEPEKESDSFRYYRQLENEEFIVAFADTSMGLGDYCATQFFSFDNMDVPIVYHSKTLASEMTPIIAAELNKISDVTHVQPIIAYERNNGGAFEMERLARLNREGKYKIYQMRMSGTAKGKQLTMKLGWDTNSATRPKMLQELKEAIDNMLIRVYDKPTINEMFSFIVAQTSTSWKAQAESGAHDDLIMSLAGAYQLYQSEQKPKYTNYFKRQRPEQVFDSITGRLIS